MLRSNTTADLIADQLNAEIMRGDIRPGAPLRQEDLATRFGVSRIPVREALRRLERDGLVAVFPNRGAFVIEVTAQDIREITHMRILVECDLIERAASLHDQSDMEALGEALELAERTAATPDWIRTDRAFHMQLYEPAAVPRQIRLAMSLRTEVERCNALYDQLPGARDEWLTDHRQMFDAYARRNAGHAAELLRGHIQRAGDFLVRCLS